jgi:hypothetical protein
MGTGNIRPAELGYLHLKSLQSQNQLGPCLTRSGLDFNVCMSNAYLNDAYMKEVYMSNEGSTPDTASGTASDTTSDISSGPKSDTSDSTSDNTPDMTMDDNLDNTMDDTMDRISDNTSVSTSSDISDDIEDDSINDGTGADIYITLQDVNEDNVLPSIEDATNYAIRDDTNLEKWPEQHPVAEDLKVSHSNQICTAAQDKH